MIVVDRIEGAMAILEIDGSSYEFPASALPSGAGEGAVLQLSLDPSAGDQRATDARARLERLKRASPKPGGKLVL